MSACSQIVPAHVVQEHENDVGTRGDFRPMTGTSTEHTKRKRDRQTRDYPL